MALASVSVSASCQLRIPPLTGHLVVLSVEQLALTGWDDYYERWARSSLTLQRSPRADVSCYPLLEPGYYADGRFGIRIENVMLVQEAKTPNNFGDKGFLRLERVTMVRKPTFLPRA